VWICKDYSIFPIRKTLVPHSGHVPFTAGRPFFSLVSLGSFMSLLALHFTQYACTILKQTQPWLYLGRGCENYFTTG